MIPILFNLYPLGAQRLTALVGCISLLATGCARLSPAKARSELNILPAPESPEVDQRVEALSRFAAGIHLELNESPQKATEQYLQAALVDIKNEELVLDVARRLVREQKSAQAVDLLKKAAAQPNAPGGYYAYLGLAYLQSGETNLAQQANLQAIKRVPDNLAAYQNLAAIHLQQGKTNDALRVLRRAAARTNAPPEFLLGMVDLLGRYKRQDLLNENESKTVSLKLLDAAASQNSPNPLIVQRIADLFLLHGEMARAEPLYADLLKRYPHIPGLRERLANLYIRMDKNELATALLEDIRREKPTDPSTYFFLGAIAYEAKDYDKAAEHYATALKLNPEFEPLYYDLAGVHIARQEPLEALALLDTAKAKFKLSFTLEFFTGIAHSMLEKWSEAISHMVSAELIAKTSEPQRLNHLFYYQLGSAYERSGNIPESEKALRKALELSPDYADALNYLGYMWAERGENLEEAYTMIKRAIELEPDNGAFLDSMGWVLFKLKRMPEALHYMNLAITHTEKPDPTLYDHLGDIHFEMKQIEKAREAYTKALTAKPDDKIKAKLETLSPR
jgi:tetratricopeptide (TPR) repeat protein